MDVGDPSNFIRIMELFTQSLDFLKEEVSGDTISDDTTATTIENVYKETGYILDPHGAVAYKALQNYLKAYPQEAGFILETAHPVKFPEVVEEAIGQTIAIPDSVKFLLDKKKVSTALAANYAAFKNWMKEGK